MSKRPLEGYRVFDFTAAKSGPYCTAILADFGADVIHIENPARPDPTRTMKPSFKGTSTEYFNIHRGKRSVQINTKTEVGRKLAYKLIAECDIFVENGKPGSAEKMGLGYEAVKAIKPDIIYASISGFGQDGPYRNRAAFDTVIQAMSGFMSLTGPMGGPFTKAGPSMSDLITGIMTALGIAMAIIRKEKTGEGTWLDSSMFDMYTSLMEAAIAAYVNGGMIRRPIGNRHPANAIAEPVRCKDGEFILQMFGNEQHQRFFAEFGMPDLTQDERFSDGPQRVKNREALVEEYVNPVLEKYTMAEIRPKLDHAKVPYGEMNTIEQLVEDPHFKYRNCMIPVTDSVNGTYQIFGSPFKFNNFDMPKETFAAQAGEHNVSVLREILHMEDGEIKNTFVQMGVEITL